jgi:hypothetical protein
MLVPMASAAVTGPTGVSVAKGTGLADGGPWTETYTAATGVLVFTAAPHADVLALTNYTDNYHFTLTKSGGAAVLNMDYSAFTPGTSTGWSHSLTYMTAESAPSDPGLTINYVPKVATTFSVTGSNVTSTPALTSDPWLSGGGFKFTATPTGDVTVANLAKYNYKWKITVTKDGSTAVTAGVTVTGATETSSGSGIFTVDVASADLPSKTFNVGLTYASLAPATVTALSIKVEIEETPISVTLTPVEASGTATTAASGKLGIAAETAYTGGAVEGVYVFKASPYSGDEKASEIADPKELGFTLKHNGSTDIPFTLIESGTTASGVTIEYSHDNEVSTGVYTVIVKGLDKQTISGLIPPVVLTVTHTTKPAVTLAKAAYTPPELNKVASVPGAGYATRGTDTVEVTTTAGFATGYEWYFTDKNTPTTIYGANTTPKVVGTYSGATSTVAVSGVTEAAEIDVAYVETPTATADTVKLAANLAGGSGVQSVTTPTRTAGTFKFTFKATIKDEYATGGTFKVYPFTGATEETTALIERTDYTVDLTDGDRGYVVTILKASPGANKYAVKYTGDKLVKTTKFVVGASSTNTATNHPIKISTTGGDIVDGKFTFWVTPTVPRVLEEADELVLASGTVTTPSDYLNTSILTAEGEPLTGATYYISQPNEAGVDTFIVSNISDEDTIKVVVKYDAPDLSFTYGVPGDQGLITLNPSGESFIATLNKGLDTTSFDVKLSSTAVNHPGGGKFSYVFTGAGGAVIDYPTATITLKKLTDNDSIYTVAVAGLRYTGTKIEVAYDTIPAKVVTPPAADVIGDKLQGSEAQAVAVAKASDEGEIVAYTVATTDFDATAPELDAYQQKGAIVPGQKLSTTLTVDNDPEFINNEKKTIVLTFSGPLSILPPLTVENVWITTPKFKVVYVFDSSTATRSRSVSTKAVADTWAEYDAVNEILYVHLVDIDIEQVGGEPSYAQLAIKSDDGKVGPVVGSSDWAVTLYDSPIYLIPDNGVPGTNYAGYFTLDGTYPTDGQMKYKVGNDADWKSFYNTITNQEIERLANGELLYFAYAMANIPNEKLDGTNPVVVNGVGKYVFIYKPKTYATTGDNPVVVPRPYAIVAANTNIVKLNFSRTAGTTTTGEFTFKVTPDEVLTNGEFDFTFTKNGTDVSPKPEAVKTPPDIDGAVSVTITNIKVSDILITVIYKQGVGVTEVSTGKVWSYGKTLFISSNKAGTAKIYSITGQLVKIVNVNTGITITELPTGIYLVNTPNNEITKIVVN